MTIWAILGVLSGIVFLGCVHWLYNYLEKKKIKSHAVQPPVSDEEVYNWERGFLEAAAKMAEESPARINRGYVPRNEPIFHNEVQPTQLQLLHLQAMATAAAIEHVSPVSVHHSHSSHSHYDSSPSHCHDSSSSYDSGSSSSGDCGGGGGGVD